MSKKYFIVPIVACLLVVVPLVSQASIFGNLWQKINIFQNQTKGVFDKNKDVSSTTPRACAQDAKQCPDGRWVNRTGPNCQFKCAPADCPKLVAPAPGFCKNGKIIYGGEDIRGCQLGPKCQLAFGGNATTSVEQMKAYRVLSSFLSALADGKYAEAAGYYDGSYDLLKSFSPAEKYSFNLLKKACGLIQCLKINKVVKVIQDGDNFVFTVRLRDPSTKTGEYCIKNTDTTVKSCLSDFDFIVKKDDNSYKVMTLPPYHQ